MMRFVRYDVLYARGEIPLGTCVFTDFDLLDTFEIDAAVRAAVAASERGALVLNWPHRAAGRFELLRRLHALGVNPTEVTRLDEAREPNRYPVFIRCEDGAWGPETDLLFDAEDYRAAVGALRRAGKTMKGRIAVSFETSTHAGGFYEKYGACVIGDMIVPLHRLRSRHWNVKIGTNEPDEAFCQEELRYVRENPHADELARIARIAEIDYGRIDYGVENGRIVVFEINTNPHFPDFASRGPRSARLPIVREALLAAFRNIDRCATGGTAPFDIVTRSDRTGSQVLGARWFEDFPRSLVSRRRWRGLLRRLGGLAPPEAGRRRMSGAHGSE